jgi:hypothetical protein
MISALQDPDVSMIYHIFHGITKTSHTDKPIASYKEVNSISALEWV